jgi:hypothetical protein
MRFYPKQRQFRVHVVGDKTRTRELIHTHGDNDPSITPIWNLNTGFTYRHVNGERPKGVIPQAKAAVAALGLDFGAVDVIVHDDIPMVLEVNTAPGLSDLTLAWYARHLGGLLDMDIGTMPGVATLN